MATRIFDEMAADLRESLEADGVALVVLKGIHGTGHGLSLDDDGDEERIAAELRMLAARTWPMPERVRLVEAPVRGGAVAEARRLRAMFVSIESVVARAGNPRLLEEVRAEISRLTDVVYPSRKAPAAARA
jgi:hypothetical protein